MAGYVYLITHRDSGRGYVGQTTNPNPIRRWQGHVCDASSRFRCTIDRAIAKYGPEAFVFEVMGAAQTQQDLDNLEKLWIITLGTQKRGIGFNIRGGGSKGNHSEESKQKLREARARQIITPEMYLKSGEKRRGIPHSLERRIKQGLSRKGWNPSPETRARMSESAKKRAARLNNRDERCRFSKSVLNG